MLHHLKELEMYINDQTNNVFEFDTLQELSDYDESYKKMVEEFEEAKKCRI